MATGTLAQRWQPRPPVPVDLDPDDVWTAVVALSATPDAGVSVSVDAEDADPLIAITEDDRSTSIRFTALIDRLNRAGTPTSRIHDAVREWADTRPVSDTAAAAHGIAVVVRHGDDARWQVSVPRPSGVIAAWVPSLTASPETIHATRAAARRRATQLTFSPTQSGRVTVWTYPPCPRLSPSVLAQPDALAAATPAADATVILTAGRPLAVADYESATRLVAEANQPHLMFALANLTDLGWM